ncbi:hypothetical protein Dcae01_01854 [Deinococcus caeni]|uniref:Uncharacterized protein n=1 Tax=Deinococcus caeni TaxID=569127 RepID=A0ABP9UHV9_9DEIO
MRTGARTKDPQSFQHGVNVVESRFGFFTQGRVDLNPPPCLFANFSVAPEIRLNGLKLLWVDLFEDLSNGVIGRFYVPDLEVTNRARPLSHLLIKQNHLW